MNFVKKNKGKISAIIVLILLLSFGAYLGLSTNSNAKIVISDNQGELVYDDEVYSIVYSIPSSAELKEPSIIGRMENDSLYNRITTTYNCKLYVADGRKYITVEKEVDGSTVNGMDPWIYAASN